MKQFTDAKELCGDILIAAFSLLCKYNERYLLKRWTNHPTPNIEEKLVHNSQQARGGISCHHRMTDGRWSQYKVRRLSHDFAKHWGNN